MKRLAAILAFCASQAAADDQWSGQVDDLLGQFEATILAGTSIAFLQNRAHPAVDIDGSAGSAAESQIVEYAIFRNRAATGVWEGQPWYIVPYAVVTWPQSGEILPPACYRLAIYQDAGEIYMATLGDDGENAVPWLSSVLPSVKPDCRVTTP